APAAARRTAGLRRLSAVRSCIRPSALLCLVVRPLLALACTIGSLLRPLRALVVTVLALRARRPFVPVGSALVEIRLGLVRAPLRAFAHGSDSSLVPGAGTRQPRRRLPTCKARTQETQRRGGHGRDLRSLGSAAAPQGHTLKGVLMTSAGAATELRFDPPGP